MRIQRYAAAGAAALPGVVAAQVELTPATLFADGMWNNPTSIAVDADGVTHVAWMAQFDTDSGSKEIWYGNDAGGAFARARITDNAVREEFPCLALDDDGRVHLAFHTGVDASNKIRYTTNKGGADAFDFRPAIDVTGAGFIIAEIDVDSAGTVHLAFASQTAQAEDVFYRTIAPDGTLGVLQNVTGSPGEEQLPDVAVGPDDAVHLVYQAGNAFGGPLVYAARGPGDASFSTVPTGVAGAVQDPIVRVDGGGKVSICYRVGSGSSAQLRLVEQTSPGGPFAPPTDLTPPGAFRPAFRENFAFAPDGRRFVTFASNVGGTGFFLVEETADGGFLDPVRIEDADGTAVGTSVAVGGSTANPFLAATWQFGAFDADAGVVFADIRVASAPLGGCPVDFNNDGLLDFFDVSAFLVLFNGGDPGADLNADGAVDFFDVSAFLAAFTTGCA